MFKETVQNTAQSCPEAIKNEATPRSDLYQIFQRAIDQGKVPQKLVHILILTSLALSACLPKKSDALSNSPEKNTVPLSQALDETDGQRLVLVGNTYLDPCRDGANPELQIEPLMENGHVVPHAYKALDLNSEEIQNGLNYGLIVPENGQSYVFVAQNPDYPQVHDTIYNVFGPTKVLGTGATIWCETGTNPDQKSKANIMDATKIPSSLDGLEAFWESPAANGTLPIPDSWK